MKNIELNIKKFNIYIVTVIGFILLIIGMLLLNLGEINVTSINREIITKERFVKNNVLYDSEFEDTISENNSQYEFMNNGNILIREYNGDADCVIIPSEIRGNKIAYIHSNAFIHSENLETIKIPVDIAKNIININYFNKNDELSNKEYTIYTTTREYSEMYLIYIDLPDEEKANWNIIPDKFKSKMQNRYDYSVDFPAYGTNGSNDSVTQNIPSSFDLRNKINVNVGSQGALGICYAYGVVSSIETNLALNKRINKNFSEIYVAAKSKQFYAGSFYTTYIESFRNAEGVAVEKENTVLDQKYLERVRAVNKYAEYIYDACVNEEPSATESELDVAITYLDSLAGAPEYYVMGYERFEFITGDVKRNSDNASKVKKNRDNIKTYIMNNGSICANIASINNGINYFMDGNKAVSYQPSNSVPTGHLVSIIGWDDNFKSSRFPSKGAWLVLNSWGDKWGNGDGTFWVSYDDYWIEAYTYAITEVAVGKVNINRVNITMDSDEYIYNGYEKRPYVSMEYAGMSLGINKDYMIEYSNNINVGTGTIKITGIGRYTGTVTKTFKIKEKDVTRAEIIVNPDVFSYDGTAKKPEVTAYDVYGDMIVYPPIIMFDYDLLPIEQKVLLIEGKDYKVEFSNNINAGTATVTITGMGNYTGTATKNYIIERALITSAEITLEPDTFEYNREAKKPKVTVRFGSNVLQDRTDYAVEYLDNVNVGTATINIYGLGNYTGKATKTFTITPKAFENIKIVPAAKMYIYSGTEKMPTPSLIDGETKLVKDRDYTITYENNVNVGTGIMEIVGMGNYTGKLNDTFTIVEKSISSAVIILNNNSYIYDGETKTPDVTVKDEERALQKDIDYTIEYSDNTTAGRCTVTINGMGNYTGSLIKTFTILQKNIDLLQISLEEDKIVFDGKEKMPKVVIKDGGYVLKQNTDYKIDYSSNILAGLGKIRILGKGNYIGNALLEFEIEKADPEYMLPLKITVASGTKLGDIKLPKGFEWEDSLKTTIEETGISIFKCMYRPEDTDNYNIITGIEVEIEVPANLQVNISEIVTVIDGNSTYLKTLQKATSLKELKEKISTNGEIRIYENDTEILENEEVVKTGMKVVITSGETKLEYIVVISADISGDGKITALDLAKLKEHMIARELLSGAFEYAADLNGDGKITSVDLARMKMVLVGQEIEN